MSPRPPLPPGLSPDEMRVYARMLTYAGAALSFARERYTEFAAWAAAQPGSPAADRAALAATDRALALAAEVAWQASGPPPVSPPALTPEEEDQAADRVYRNETLRAQVTAVVGNRRLQVNAIMRLLAAQHVAGRQAVTRPVP